MHRSHIRGLFRGFQTFSLEELQEYVQLSDYSEARGQHCRDRCEVGGLRDA